MRAVGRNRRAFLGTCIVTVVSLLVLAIGASPAGATSLTFNLSVVFSGNVPVGVPPYLTAQFRDGTDCSPACGAGTVQLVLSSNLTSPQFATEWDFNSSNLGVVVTYDSANALNAGSYTAPTIQPTSSNAYQADGAGNFDIEIDFATPAAGRFDGTDVAVFSITGSGINVFTFNQLSTSSSKGVFHTAAHVQGIPTNCSGWVGDTGGESPASNDGPCTPTVPEPSTLLLLGASLAGVGLWGRKKFMRRFAGPKA